MDSSGYAQPGAAPAPMIHREAPELDPGTLALIESWCDRIRRTKVKRKPLFDRMKQWQKFTRGVQWEKLAGDAGELKDERYITFITLRRISQRTAAIYAKNPRVVARRRNRMEYEVWDEKPSTLQQAQMMMQSAMSGMAGMALAAGAALGIQSAAALLADYKKGKERKAILNKVGRTLEYLAQYSLDEPIPKFKVQAKQLVRRVLTCGVGFVKIGYQRQFEYTEDQNARIKDITDKLKRIEQLSADLADGAIEWDGEGAAELKQQLEDLQRDAKLVREGMVYDFPKPWQIIIDLNCTQLKGLIGAGWYAHEHLFSCDKVKQIYGCDVSASAKKYDEWGAEASSAADAKETFACVWEVYDIDGQLCFTLCDGYNGYLKPPGQPQVQLDQWHPLYVLSFNDVEDDTDIYPPSDVEIVMPAVKEIDRAREGLRQHRIANRPAYIGAKGVIEEQDKMKLANHADSEFLELNIPQTAEIGKIIQAKPTVTIDPALYDVEPYFTDILRSSGDAEANLGGTSGATATESSIAESSRVTSVQSNIDDLDEFLTDVMRGTGQILLTEMDAQTVKRIVGPGAVWPELSAQDIAEEIYLEVKAGSSGRPNKALRVANAEKIMPFLLQVPGVKPAPVAEFLLRELDDGLELDDFMEEGLPSITAMNAQSKPQTSPEPGAQGDKGAQNTPKPTESPARAQNMNPAPNQAPNPAAMAPAG